MNQSKMKGRKRLRPFFVCLAGTRYTRAVKPALIASVLLASFVTTLPAYADPPVDPFFGADKAKHFTISAALAASGYGLSAIVFDGRKNRAVLGATLAIGAGYSKEVLDAVGFGTPSWKDFVWDVIGTGVGVGLAIAVDAAFSPASASSTRMAPAPR
jgi:putative lipoprotein